MNESQPSVRQPGGRRGDRHDGATATAHGVGTNTGPRLEATNTAGRGRRQQACVFCSRLPDWSTRNDLPEVTPGWAQMTSPAVRVAVVAVCGLVAWYGVTEVTSEYGLYVQAGAGLAVGLVVYIGLVFLSGSRDRRRR